MKQKVICFVFFKPINGYKNQPKIKELPDLNEIFNIN